MMKVIRRARHHNVKEHFKYLVLSVTQLLATLLNIATLGFLVTEIDRMLLFSDWLEKEE